MSPSAIILAAGAGSRLMPLTADRPKCMVELENRPLIEWHLETLREAGVSDITIVTGYCGDMLSNLGCRTVYNKDWQETNMVESLFCTERYFTDDIIVAYADIYYQPNILQALIKSSEDISVVVDLKWRSYWEQRFEDPLTDAENLQLDGSGAILEIGSPPQNLDDINGQYIGLLRFQNEGINTLKESKQALGATHRYWMKNRSVRGAYMTDLLMEIIETGKKLYAVKIDRNWIEIDSIHDYELACNIFKKWGIKEKYA